MKYAFLLFLFSSVALSQPTVKYDSAENMTRVYSAHLSVVPGDLPFTLTLMQHFDGKNIIKKDDVVLIFWFSSTLRDAQAFFVSVENVNVMKFQSALSDERTSMFRMSKKTINLILDDPKPLLCIGYKNFSLSDSTKTAFKKFIAFIDSASSFDP